MYLDPAGELRANALEETLQSWGTTFFITAEAWQRGRVERHGQIIKRMLSRIDTEKPIANVEEFDMILLQCFQAKNSMIRRFGFSPEQIVLGKAPRLPASLCSDSSASTHTLAASNTPEGDVFRLRLERRMQAQQAFAEADNNEAIRRSLLRRSNPSRNIYRPGQWVLYWLKRNSPNRSAAGRWHGPARVISVDGSTAVSLSHNTKTVRAPPEFLRPASLREWNQLSHEERTSPILGERTGGASQYVDLVDSSAPEGSSAVANAPQIEVRHVEMPIPVSGPATGLRLLPTPHAGTSRVSEHSEDLGQPEQELTPQVSINPQQAEGSEVTAIPTVSAPGPVPEQMPLPEDAEEGLYVEEESLSLLAQESIGDRDLGVQDLSHHYTFQSGEVPDVLLAEDDLPWHAEPLGHSVDEVYCLEIPLKARDLKKWLGESNPTQMAHIASAGKRSRVEVSVRSLSPQERLLFQEAKEKELTCWLQTSAVRRILRQKLNPDQILRSRWVLTWKTPDNDADPRKAKARLVVLGYEDPQLTNVARDSPTLTREGRATVLQSIASQKWRLQSFDIKTAFPRGKADPGNKLAMEPPEELRTKMGLRPEEVCELVGNAYGRVDAPLLFYRELKLQLLKLGFSVHPLDPCIFLLESTADNGRVLHGILGVHVDDGLCGGDSKFRAQIAKLQQVLPFGSQKQSAFTFTGIELEQLPDFSIRARQESYLESILPVHIPRDRRLTPEASLNPTEMSSLRGIIGSLQYGVTHTRPDLAARLSEVQSQMSRPTVNTLLEANRVPP